jgi:hypothetical protein
VPMLWGAHSVMSSAYLMGWAGALRYINRANCPKLGSITPSLLASHISSPDRGRRRSRAQADRPELTGRLGALTVRSAGT